jgi:enterochelin esterase-like enzyme
MRAILLALLALIASPAVAGDGTGPVHVSAGNIVDLGVFKSKYSAPRRVVVWLPPGYQPHGRKSAVLYMHDGQNLFDKATSATGMEWEVDEHLSRLIRERKVKPAIVVGIWNTPKRRREYLPEKLFDRLPRDFHAKVEARYGGGPLSAGYLKFLVRELKPAIDRRFNVNTDRANTAILGSSMGALISLYAIDEYPDVFGSAGMMSTHWPLVTNANGKPVTDADYLAVSTTLAGLLPRALPSAATHRLYFDRGSMTLDSVYPRYQERVDATVAERGYTPGVHWLTRIFPGQGHDEISWASRLDVPLRFLLPPERLSRK